MAKNSLDLPAHAYAGLTIETVGEHGFSPPATWDAASIPRGSIVDFLLESGEVRRFAVGNVTYDKWDDEEMLYLRWPYQFDDEYMSAVAYKLVVLAPTSEEAGYKAIFDAIEEAFGPASTAQHAHIKLRIDALRCAAIVAGIDWESSSLYC